MTMTEPAPSVEPVEYFGNWTPPPRPVAVCNGCLLEAKDIEEYVLAADDANVAGDLDQCQSCLAMPGENHMSSCPMFITPDDYVWQEEGTLNPKNGHFLCTTCYIAAGMPSSSQGWKAP